MAMIGLPYEGQYKTTKLAYAAQGGTGLVQPKRVDHIGLILGLCHNAGLRYGPDFTTMDELPRMFEGAAVTPGQIYTTFDAPSIEFPGDWNTDSRMCLAGRAPRPATVLAAILSISTNDRL